MVTTEAFFEAARTNNRKIVKSYLNQAQANVNVLEEDTGNTALHIAFEAQATGVLKLLLDLDPKVIKTNIQNKEGKTPIDLLLKHYGTGKITAKMVTFLLSWHVVLHFTWDEIDSNALFYALVKAGNEQQAKMLLKDPRYEMTIDDLNTACDYGCPALVEIILKSREVNPNKLGELDYTPLMLTANPEVGAKCPPKHQAILQLLLSDPRIEPNKTGPDGNTALHIACRNTLLSNKLLNDKLRSDDKVSEKMHSHDYVVWCLLCDPRVNCEQKNLEGQTPADVARENERYDIVKMIEDVITTRKKCAHTAALEQEILALKPRLSPPVSSIEAQKKRAHDDTALEEEHLAKKPRSSSPTPSPSAHSCTSIGKSSAQFKE